LGKRLLTTVALFKAEQEGLGTFAGYVPETGTYYYVGQDVVSKGVELEVNGQVSANTHVVFGFTSLSLKDDDGADTYTWVPRRTLNFSIDTRLRSVNVGLGGQWRSQTSTTDSYTGFTVRQDAYIVLNAFARWDATDNLQLKVNINNLA